MIVIKTRSNGAYIHYNVSASLEAVLETQGLVNGSIELLHQSRPSSKRSF